jgi:arylsulfatase A-like enzyme
VLNGISLEDVVPSVMAAAGVPDIKEQLRKGYQAGAKRFQVHLDGYNQLPYLMGQSEESRRNEFYYYGERELYAIRYRNRKIHFQIKNDWFAGQSITPTVPRPVNLRVDPFEQHMDRRPMRFTAERSSGRSYPQDTFSNSTWRHLRNSRRVRRPRASIPARCWSVH